MAGTFPVDPESGFPPRLTSPCEAQFFIPASGQKARAYECVPESRERACYAVCAMGVTDAKGAQGRGPGAMTSSGSFRGSGKNTPRSRRGVPEPSSCNSARKAESALVFVVPGIILDKDAPGAILRCPLVIGRMGDRLLVKRKVAYIFVNKMIDAFVNFDDDCTETGCRPRGTMNRELPGRPIRCAAHETAPSTPGRRRIVPEGLGKCRRALPARAFE